MPRLATGLAVILVFAALVPAAGASTPAQRLAWLRPWSSWTSDLENDLDAATSFPKQKSGAGALFTRLSTCDRAARLPAAPADFRRLARLDAAVCAMVTVAAGFGADALGGDANALSSYAPAIRTADNAFSNLLDVAWTALWFNRTLPVLGGQVSTDRIEPTLSRSGAAVFGIKPLQVRCWSAAGWNQAVNESSAWYLDSDTPDDIDGFAEPDDRRVFLPESICGPLTRLVYGDRDVSEDDAAYSIGTWTHEVSHIAHPEASEAVAECYGMQKVYAGALALGYAAPDARELSTYYWDEIYANDEADGYTTPKCRPNGPLDQTPGDGVWP